MKTKPNIAVIGCGIFGATAALKLQEHGFDVSIFERLNQPLCGASYNNQNRLHLGFHYPRDIVTAQQCIKGFEEFKMVFSEAIRDDFPNAYFIAKDGSFTTPEEYLLFCDKLGIDYEQFAVEDFLIPVRDTVLGILCKETVYDSKILKKIILHRFKENNIDLHLNTNIKSIKNQGDSLEVTFGDGSKEIFDAIVNASYANINRFTEQLEHTTEKHQYEYTVVPVVKTPFPGNIGITIMDGPFMTLLPFGKSNYNLLYHVEHTVIDRSIKNILPPEWLNEATSPFNDIDKEVFFNIMVDKCSQFIPTLTGAQIAGFLHGPRMVLANRDKTDERPSVINSYQRNYVTIFSGKIDHCLWVAEDVVKRLEKM